MSERSTERDLAEKMARALRAADRSLRTAMDHSMTSAQYNYTGPIYILQGLVGRIIKQLDEDRKGHSSARDGWEPIPDPKARPKFPVPEDAKRVGP